MTKGQKNRATWGFAFVTLILLCAVFVGLAGAIGSQVTQGVLATRKRMSHSSSRYAAYAGLQHALLLLRLNPSWNEPIDPTPMPGNKSVCYAVDLTNNLTGSSNINLPGGVVVPPGSVYAASVGINKADNSELQLHAMTGVMAQGNPTITHAAFTDNAFTLTGAAQSNSFDPATVGFSIDAEQRAVPSVLNAQGTVGSNRYATIDPTTQVNGDLYKPQDLVLPPATGSITGDIIPLDDPVSVPVLKPPVDFTSPQAALTNPTALSSANPAQPKVIESLTLTGGSVTVEPGRYFFPNGIDVNGMLELSSSVNSNNPVIFFVGNDATFGDAARVNVAGETRNFQIVMVDVNDGTPQTFTMEGKSQIFGAVLAGRAEGTMSDTASLFGGFMGRSLSCGDSSQIVYDESLASNPLTISSAWGLHGVTEPKPEIVLAAYPALKMQIQTFDMQTAVTLQPVSQTQVMPPKGTTTLSGYTPMTAQPMLSNPAPILP
jgi:hypothetical protein